MDDASRSLIVALLWIGACLFAWIVNVAMWIKIGDTVLFATWAIVTAYILKGGKGNGEDNSNVKDDDTATGGGSVRG